MATETVIDPTPTYEDERSRIALEATYELEQLLSLILEQTRDKPDGQEWVERMRGVRGLVIRGQSLNSALMSALGESDMPTSTIVEMVTGMRAAPNEDESHG